MVVVALLVGLGVYSIAQLASVNASTVDLATNWMPGARLATLLKNDLNRLRVTQNNLIMAQSESENATALKDINTQLGQVKKTADGYAQLIASQEERALYDSFKSQMEQFLGEQMEAGRVLDAVISQSESQARNMWKIREGVAEAGRAEGPGLSYDISVSVSKIPEFIDRGIQAALAILEERAADFDLVFTDVVMPGMSGIEMGHEIRKRWPGLEVILTSGYSHVLAQEGDHGFQLVRKPYSIDELIGALKRKG